MKERGAREADPFDEVMTTARVIDVTGEIAFEQLVVDVSAQLALDLPVSAERLVEGFVEGTHLGATPVSHGAALPHLRLKEIDRPHMVLVRSRQGVGLDEGSAEPICALFFLVSPEVDPGLHLRILAQLASRIDQDGFMSEWLAANTEQKLKEALIREERMLVLRLSSSGTAASLIGLSLRDVELPEGTLIAMIRRAGELIIPRGATALEAGDRLTLIGRIEGISELRQTYD
jgi:mannitol/fructose-specific phosphotransferase system IIA component (Ntr-type)